MSDARACPCGKPSSYAACCGALHRGDRLAATPEELMRSRYAAYSEGLVDYLLETLHPSKRGSHDRRSLEASVSQLRWTGLAILDVRGGTFVDTTGIVEFEASYETAGTRGVLHERSNFVRENGRWLYVDGTMTDREQATGAPGRGAPCPCGSGRKFKRCCGAK